jgi:hypothetical protein
MATNYLKYGDKLMAKVLPITPAPQGHTEMATVQGGLGREFMVHGSMGVISVSLSFSCLVSPEAGDRVLLSCCAGQSHILAIIERPNQDDMKLAFPGNVAFQAKEGSIDLLTSQRLSLTSAQAIKVTSAEFSMNSLKMNVHSEEATVSGGKATSQWREVTSIATSFNLIVDSLTQRLKNSFKMVQGVDQQSSQNLLQTIGKTFSVRARDTVIIARKDVKIDGERIHMG